MNLRRGLFRVWIAASVVWIGAVATWAYKDLAPLVDRDGIFVWQGEALSSLRRIGNPSTELEAARELEKSGQLVSFPLPHFAGYSVFLPAAVIAPDERTRRIEKVESIVADLIRITNGLVRDLLFTKWLPLAVLPPILVMLSALVLAWIAAGFRRSSN